MLKACCCIEPDDYLVYILSFAVETKLFYRVQFAHTIYLSVPYRARLPPVWITFAGKIKGWVESQRVAIERIEIGVEEACMRLAFLQLCSRFGMFFSLSSLHELCQAGGDNLALLFVVPPAELLTYSPCKFV